MVQAARTCDAIIIGAGFSGLYQLHCLRDRLGLGGDGADDGARLPAFDAGAWRETAREHHPADERHACAINLGRRPTFYEHADRSLLEAHLIDFAGDLYGETAHVEFTHFLRSERKFDGIDALISQLKQDIEHARGQLGI